MISVRNTISSRQWLKQDWIKAKMKGVRGSTYDGVKMHQTWSFTHEKFLTPDMWELATICNSKVSQPLKATNRPTCSQGVLLALRSNQGSATTLALEKIEVKCQGLTFGLHCNCHFTRFDSTALWVWAFVFILLCNCEFDCLLCVPSKNY